MEKYRLAATTAVASRTLPINDYPGKLIAIEGTDGVGRTTQIQLLREWLEVKGFGVVETGWTRSPLDAADHRAGQVEQHAEQADVRLALRDGLRRPTRKGSHSRAQGRVRRAVGSLHFHGTGAGGRAGSRPALAAEASMASRSRRTLFSI